MQIVRRIGERKEISTRKFFDEKRKTFSFVVANFFLKEYNIIVQKLKTFSVARGLSPLSKLYYRTGVEEKWDIR